MRNNQKKFDKGFGATPWLELTKGYRLRTRMKFKPCSKKIELQTLQN